MNGLKFWAVFSIGVAAGAAVALLYAPQKGTRVRKQLRGKLNEAGEYLGEQYDDASEYVKEQASELGKQAGKTYQQARKAAEGYSGDVVSGVQSAVKSVKG